MKPFIVQLVPISPLLLSVAPCEERGQHLSSLATLSVLEYSEEVHPEVSLFL